MYTNKILRFSYFACVVAMTLLWSCGNSPKYSPRTTSQTSGPSSPAGAVVTIDSPSTPEEVAPDELPTVDSCMLECAPEGACADHGGVECALGPDVDGSIICMDGYKDSPQMFECPEWEEDGTTVPTEPSPYTSHPE